MSENSIHEGFKITELGPLPEEWGIVWLGEVAEKFIGGGTPSTSKEEYWGGEIHWTTSKKINGIYLLDGEKKITKRGLEESSTHLIPKDNLVIGTRVGVGKVAINKVDIAISQDLTGAFIDKEKYALEFLAYQICTKEIQNIFKGRARGTTIKGIPRDDLKKIPLKIPPLPEQHRIAAVLSAVHDAKEKTEAVIAAAKSLKKSLMRHLFTYGPVSAGAAEGVPLVETEIGLVPEGWEVVMLEKLTKRRATKGATPTTYGHNWVEEGILFLRSECIEENKLSLNGAMFISEEAHESMERSKVYPGDILIRITGDVGIACVFPGDYKEANINQHISIVRLKQDTHINKDFLAYALNSPNQRKYFHSITGGITHPHLNLAQIRETPISIPPLPTQQKISHILSTADKKIEAEENKKKALDELFKSLLHNLMTAKIRVNHLEMMQ